MSDLLTYARMTEDEARTYLERLRWSDGPVCPHCGTVDEATPMKSKKGTTHKLRPGTYNCRACRKPFTVTVGTIFEGSKIPLSKWLVGFYLFSSSKKGISALQLQRQLGLGSYRTAWHMAHRIRHALENEPDPTKLAGTVEADEVFIGGKPRNRRKGGQGKTNKTPVAVLVERGEEGRVRTRVFPERMTTKTIRQFITEHVDRDNAELHTDEAAHYKLVGRTFAGGHQSVKHSAGEYARDGVHNNTAESFNGLFKRSIDGAWHHISRVHLRRYLAEQVFRWNFRKLTDEQRTEIALQRVTGVRLYYRAPRLCVSKDSQLKVG